MTPWCKSVEMGLDAQTNNKTTSSEDDCALLKDCYSDKLHVMPSTRNDLEQSNVTPFKAIQMMTVTVFLVLMRLTNTLP